MTPAFFTQLAQGSPSEHFLCVSDVIKASRGDYHKHTGIFAVRHRRQAPRRHIRAISSLLLGVKALLVRYFRRWLFSRSKTCIQSCIEIGVALAFGSPMLSI
jgi:hypothetical protein